MFKNIFRLRLINDYLTVVLVVIIFYILLAPLLPQVTFWMKHEVASTQSSQPVVEKKEKEKIPNENTLRIPSMYLEESIHEGKYADTLSKGVWRRPNSSTPDLGGNTVVAGHRFTYRGQAVFYHLDKIRLDDTVVVFWNGKKYEYKVNKIHEVSPHAVDIEKNTNTPQLTLYTCTPLWTVERRLVIQAALVEQKQ